MTPADWEASFRRAAAQLAEELALYLQLRELGFRTGTAAMHDEIAAYLGSRP